MKYGQLAAILLVEWRLAERRLASVDPESEEADELRSEAQRLCDAYRKVVAEAFDYHLYELDDQQEA